MSYSKYAGLGRIADLPHDSFATEPGSQGGSFAPIDTSYAVGFTMPSAEASPAGITGWVKLGGAEHTEYTDVQTALKQGHVRRRTAKGETTETVIFPMRDHLKMTAQAAIDAGLIDAAAAAVIATRPAIRQAFGDSMGDDVPLGAF